MDAGCGRARTCCICGAGAESVSGGGGEVGLGEGKDGACGTDVGLPFCGDVGGSVDIWGTWLFC